MQYRTVLQLLTRINLLKTVYLDIYTEDNYLRKFDKGIIDSIKYHYNNDCTYINEKRVFIIDKTEYMI